jgi:hypothetical protein
MSKLPLPPGKKRNPRSTKKIYKTNNLLIGKSNKPYVTERNDENKEEKDKQVA